MLDVLNVLNLDELAELGRTTNNLSTMAFHTHEQLVILDIFRVKIERERSIHTYASNYYDSLQMKFTIPGIVITGLCSVASFILAGKFLADKYNTGISISIGILNVCATVLQSITASYGFALKKESYQKAADAYDNLVTKLEFELCNPNEEFTLLCNWLEDQILKIKMECDYLPPLFIIAKYEADLTSINTKPAMNNIAIPDISISENGSVV